MSPNTYWILNTILLVGGLLLILNHRFKKALGRNIFEVFRNYVKGESIIDQAMKDGRIEPNYFLLFNKLQRLTGIEPLELFKIARTEMGFGHSDDAVERHLNQFIAGNCETLPNYVEAFIDQGKQYIIDA